MPCLGSRRAIAALSFASLSALFVAIPTGGCTNPADATIPAGSCGNGALDPGETCDRGVASGSLACPTSCNDGNACTTDVLSGDACTAKCEHSPIVACVSGDGCCPSGCAADRDSDCEASAGRCGDGVVGPDEACDTAIESGPGACPDTCGEAGEGDDPCTPKVVEGKGCQAKCVTKKITQPKNGDACCPAGATKANDNDCLAGYGEACTAGAQCESGMCFTVGAGMCTKKCSMTGAIGQCGKPGHFCMLDDAENAFCVPFANTAGGGDNEDRYVGTGVPYTAGIQSANDADAFVADLTVGIYTLTLTPSVAQLDLVMDIYDGTATLVSTANLNGAGNPEVVDYTVSVPSRSIFIVRSANGVQGNYTLHLVKKT